MPLPKINPADVIKRERPSGMKFFMVEDKTLPIVHVSINLKAGRIYEPSDKKGLSKLTVRSLLRTGAGSWSPEKFEEQIADIGGDFYASSSRETATLGFCVLSQDFETAVRLLMDAVFAPKFEASRFTMIKRKMIDALLKKSDEPNEVASRMLRKKMFGENNPWGWYPKAKDIRQIERSDAIAFYKRYFHPENMWVAAAGDFDPQKLVDIVDEYARKTLGGFEGVPAYPPKDEFKMGETKDVDFPTPQAYVRLGMPIKVSDHDPKRFAGYVGNEILGGATFKNRLMQEVRAKKGLVYGIGSSVSFMPQFGSFGIGAATSPDKVDLVLEESKRQLTMIMKFNPSGQEMFLAKRSLLGDLLLSLSKPFSVATKRMSYDMFDFPANEWEVFRRGVESTSADDVNRFFRENVDPASLVTVIVTKKKAEAETKEGSKK